VRGSRPDGRSRRVLDPRISGAVTYSVAAGHFGRGHLPQPFEAFASFIFERTESPGQLRELGWLGCRTCFSSGESEEFSAAAPSSRRAADWKKRCMQ
jgi:hypothetical protein